MNLSVGPELTEEQIHSLIESIVLNENPNLSDLLRSAKNGSVKTIKQIVMELTMLRGHSDLGFTVAQFHWLAMICEQIFIVYVQFCEQLTEGKSQMNLSWGDMNILLNSIRTYFKLQDNRRCYLSEYLRGHVLFTYSVFWQNTFLDAVKTQVIIDEDQMVNFTQITAQIVVYLHLMRAFGLVEEDVRVWAEHYIELMQQHFPNVPQEHKQQFLDQSESVFGSADKEETDFPLITRNRLVRVIPGQKGFKQFYVHQKQLKHWEFVEVPVFSTDQEQLLKELTTLMSEPESMQLLQVERFDIQYRLKHLQNLTKNVGKLQNENLNAIEQENIQFDCQESSNSENSTPSQINDRDLEYEYELVKKSCL